jgi:NADP-reducing hydrogenase subunit HndD
VMEAALRTAYYEVTGKEHDLIKFEAVRGFEGVREASVDMNGTKVKVAVAHGMRNAKPLLDDIRAGTSPYHFIEIMGCPGGCINGGGQPFVKPLFLPNEKTDILETYRSKRASVLYKRDENTAVRQSHHNKQVQDLYENYLGAPNGHRAHELLHTHYAPRERFPK